MGPFRGPTSRADVRQSLLSIKTKPNKRLPILYCRVFEIPVTLWKEKVGLGGSPGSPDSTSPKIETEVHSNTFTINYRNSESKE